MWLTINTRAIHTPGMTVEATDVIEIGDDLLERYPDFFTEDFGTNKHLVSELFESPSVHLRNRVAGYLTRKCREN